MNRRHGMNGYVEINIMRTIKSGGVYIVGSVLAS